MVLIVEVYVTQLQLDIIESVSKKSKFSGTYLSKYSESAKKNRCIRQVEHVIFFKDFQKAQSEFRVSEYLRHYLYALFRPGKVFIT